MKYYEIIMNVNYKEMYGKQRLSRNSLTARDTYTCLKMA